jgi:cytochrome c-type biogenesis protein CcmH/NrfG
MSEDAQKHSTDWTKAQTYGLAVICLLVGVVVGYLLRGSGPAPVSAAQAQAKQSPQSPPDTRSQVTPEQLRHMAEQQAAPLISQLKIKPSDPTLLTQLGNVYYDTQQFQDAIDYYRRALQSDPKNTNVRTDLATAYWYVGNPDRAISEFDTVLKQEPNKSNALFNRGVVRWQGKMDVKGAVADWETLLKADPNYPERPKVEQLIAQAKQHLNVKPGEKTSKPAM